MYLSFKNTTFIRMFHFEISGMHNSIVYQCLIFLFLKKKILLSSVNYRHLVVILAQCCMCMCALLKNKVSYKLMSPKIFENRCSSTMYVIHTRPEMENGEW